MSMFRRIAKHEGVTAGLLLCAHRDPGWCEGTCLKRGEVEEYWVRHPAGGGALEAVGRAAPRT